MEAYQALMEKIFANATRLPGKYAFLEYYRYDYGADQLTPFGQEEMFNSGRKFYHRYPELARQHTPFVRSSGGDRVVMSAQNWTFGYHSAKVYIDDNRPDPDWQYPIRVIPEDDGVNNTLNHGLCTAFENGPDSDIASAAQAQWAAIFVPPIQARLNTDLPGVDLTIPETIYLMDLCAFDTVAHPDGTVSPFCHLFTPPEFEQYSYFETLNKYYGYGYGNPLGPTQGVGWTNELIARLTGEPVDDHTSSNRTLDGNETTFPLGAKIYADFSHDNDMTSIFFAMGLYADTPALSNTSMMGLTETGGYSAAVTVPFAARMYVERMSCGDEKYWGKNDMVRVLVNDRVVVPPRCWSDEYGMCTVLDFVKSLGWAARGGRWRDCDMEL